MLFSAPFTLLNTRPTNTFTFCATQNEQEPLLLLHLQSRSTARCSEKKKKVHKVFTHFYTPVKAHKTQKKKSFVAEKLPLISSAIYRLAVSKHCVSK